MKLTKGMENAPLSSSYQRKVSGVGNMSEAQHSFLSVNTPDFWNTSIYDDSSIQCAYIQPGFAATFSFWCMFPSIVCCFPITFKFFEFTTVEIFALFFEF